MTTSTGTLALRRGIVVLLVIALVASWGASTAPSNASPFRVETTTTVMALDSARDPFFDVPETSPHAFAIGLVAEAGIARGCAPRQFCPQHPLTRAQMASMLAKTFGLETTGPAGFIDVARTSVHISGIDALAAAGATKGCGQERFCPNELLTREQMASLLVRLLGLQPTNDDHRFVDTGGSIHAPAIHLLAASGITKGCAPERFCGTELVTRAQFASLLLKSAEGQVQTAARNAKNNRDDGSSGDAGGTPTDNSRDADASQQPTPSVEDKPNLLPAPDDLSQTAGLRLLYSDGDVLRFRSSMSRPGPYFATGDAGHGGIYSPGDGQRSVRLAREFVAAPRESYWTQTGLPYAPGVPFPGGMTYVRPMHAAWVFMTQPGHPDRGLIERELKALLLSHARNPTLDFSDSTKYPPNYHGSALNPIFDHAAWMTRMMKTRDMLGRGAFSSRENEEFDQWIYGYANWVAKWLHIEVYGKHLPGRYNRDYSKVPSSWSTLRDHTAYDGNHPPFTTASFAYTNRHAAVASAMSLAANYIKHYKYSKSLLSLPAYGVFTIDQLLEHSRLFVEETLRFSVYPEGFQGDFGRGSDPSRAAQTGWLYSVNVLANLVEMADYHAKRGDYSVWRYSTVEGLAGSRGVPIAGGFTAKNLHFYAWAMSRYVNDGWGRTNRGEPLALPRHYNDVIPAATVHQYAPHDRLLEAAWKRTGQGFPAYPQSPQSQGSFPAHHGEGAKMIGLIEHARP
jgi:hypothetical protein